ncbi:hypothetical protein QCD70_04140 [Agreia sp. PsM10]|uniref:hypothetical protein n=1 Tax=Agreia sp. PsM10 TaxID=3030533 RepID=UPI00263B4A95|nr:hypothetical protein [Agreia sp. PsM10]MDN4639427.1 hypothetical protein [Agreia sp. PsM10]
MSLTPELVSSRRVLVDVIERLEAQRDALVVLGAHAVWEVTKHDTDLPPMDPTHDADLGVIPQLLLHVPLLDQVMDAAGLEPADMSRPGVWGLKTEQELPFRERLTIDLIAAASVAGGRLKGRSADVGSHGKRSVSKTQGTELSLVDKREMELESFEDSGQSVTAWVAGPAALLCAKAYKVIDRLDPKELERNPARYKPKDIADMYRLIVVSDGAEVRTIFEEGIARSDIGDAVTEGKRRLLELSRRLDGNFMAQEVAQQWGYDTDDQVEVASVIRAWFEDFTAVDRD